MSLSMQDISRPAVDHAKQTNTMRHGNATSETRRRTKGMVWRWNSIAASEIPRFDVLAGRWIEREGRSEVSGRRVCEEGGVAGAVIGSLGVSVSWSALRRRLQHI